MNPDVPSPIDLRSMTDALEWEATAMQKRPWRVEFFQIFVDELRRMHPIPIRVLELGSGPGFLARTVLEALPDVQMTLLDFSEAMHTLARQRISDMTDRATFITRSFKDSKWTDNLDAFPAVITNQAVHELRHKRYARELHEQVASILMSGGIYLVCDHFCGSEGMSNAELFMTVQEQRMALESAGFATISQIQLKGSMVLHRAVK